VHFDRLLKQVLIDEAAEKVARTELARASRLPFRPFQLLDESNKFLQFSEALDWCELQIFANQRDVDTAILTADYFRMGQFKIPRCVNPRRCFRRLHAQN